MTTQTTSVQTQVPYRHGRGRRTYNQRSRDSRKQDINNNSSPPHEISAPSAVEDETSKHEAATNDTSEENLTDRADPDICWICAEPVKFYSLSKCNHRICHVCALRLRALYKKKDCTFCKHPQDSVVFTSSPSSQFEDYKLDEMTYKDPKLLIFFETQEMMEDTLILLRFNCPDEDCPVIARGWNDLKVHVRAEHGRQLCDLCIRMKKVFAHEHTLYTAAQLQVHLPSLPHRGKGVSRDKEVPEGGTHPLCEFCRECYFGDDELFAHMRERHEECFICKRQGVRDQYFRDYVNLESHFNTAHHPCKQPACQAQKFVVFGSLVDLKAHMVEQHGANMSTKDIREARRLETNFDFDDNRGAAGRRRERDRVRVDGQEAPHFSAPQSRAVDRRRDGFGAALTGQNETGSRVAVNQWNGRSSPSLPGEIDPEIARRHAAFMDRVARLTSNSSTAETSVRSAIKSFRASESSARDLVSTFYNIIDRDLEATASLIVPLVDLLDDEDKKNELLESFNGFKVEQRQQFPDLVPEGQGPAYAGVASGRVLNIKHSTQPRRNPGQVWDRVARAASSSVVPGAAGPSSRQPDRFPALHRTVLTPSNVVTPAFRQPQRSTPWSSASSSAAVASAPAASSRTFSVKVGDNSPGKAPSLSNAAFPSLPSAPVRTKPPLGGNKSLRNVVGSTAPSSNAWGKPSNNPSEDQATENIAEEGQDDGGQQKKGKKKGKEKVTLFTLGTFPT